MTDIQDILDIKLPVVQLTMVNLLVIMTEAFSFLPILTKTARYS